MCRLLGIIANKPVDLEFSLQKFKEFSIRNPDGWGIGWYEKGKAKVFKQGIKATDRESKLSILSKQVKSHIIISHVRKRTEGSASTANSHPFKFNNWLFAHNGSIDKKYISSLLRESYIKALKGETDSEIYFFWLLQNIEDHGDIVLGLKSALDIIKNNHYTGLNFLLSDGNCLIAFRYSSNLRDYYSLYSLERKNFNIESFDYISKETDVLLRSKLLNSEASVLICSEKLTEENWKEIELGNIHTIDSGLNKIEMRIIS